jgi:hypothetical protein
MDRKYTIVSGWVRCSDMPPNRTSSSCSNTRTLPTASTTYGPMTMLLVPGCRSRLAYTLWCCATCTQFMLASTVYRPVPAPDAAATGGRRQGVGGGGGSGGSGMVGRRRCANGSAARSSRRARDAGILSTQGGCINAQNTTRRPRDLACMQRTVAAEFPDPRETRPPLLAPVTHEDRAGTDTDPREAPTGR